jgi:diguanylate cyclase (GGDEF)-like protein
MTISMAFSVYAAVILALAAISGGLGVWNRCLRRGLEARVRHYVARDTLTGLPSRVLLHDRLTQAIAAAERRNGGVTLIFVDIDRFKAVNNTFGHDAGDAVLKQIASRLRDCVGSTDTVARLGGDEFVLVMSEIGKPHLAAIAARQVLEQFASAFILDGQKVYCTASAGIAMHPGDGTSAEALIRNADIAAHRAKDHGRNRFEFFMPEMHSHAVRKQRMETALRGALEREEFVLYYQPVFDVASGSVNGFEALIRWRHPEHGLIAPCEFVPVLEEVGLISQVGEWVIDTACAQIRHWADRGLPARIAVNLSARQFQVPGLDGVVERIVRAHGIDPAMLELELTESVLMQDPDQTALTLQRLKALGVRISIDDFGTGYSGLAYLRRFDVDVLKIDRMFLSEADAVNGEVMTRAIIDLGHALGLRVIAEGVERPSQLAFLRELGCDEMQGFLFSAAMPAHEAQAFCERHQKE